MNRFQRSWLLFKSSLAVMTTNRKLLLFPVIVTAFTLLVALVFLMPVAFQPTGHSFTSGEHWRAALNTIYDVNALHSTSNAHGQARAETLQNIRPLGVIYFAAIYLASMFCATFFNVAFYREIMNALKGQPVSIRAGIRFAATKWKSILLWTLFAGAVGMIIKALEERFGLIGRLVLKLVGTAWSVASVFVIPVLIQETETNNPFVMLKKSALTLTRTWGESLIGYAGVSFGGLLILLFSLVWLGGGIALAVALHFYWLILFVALAWLLSIVTLSYLMGIASQIFRCALFVYATEGAMPHPYNEEMAQLAWKFKKQK